MIAVRCVWRDVDFPRSITEMWLNTFVTSGRATTGFSYGRFKAIRYKLNCQLRSKEPLVIGRKVGYGDLEWQTLLVAAKGYSLTQADFPPKTKINKRNFRTDHKAWTPTVKKARWRTVRSPKTAGY
jgi:hypothetical protein